MDVVIAGGHGQIALELERLLAGAEHRVRGLIRNPDHAGDLREAGAEPVACDLEALDVDELAALIGSAGAIVFAAGAGPGSGPQRKWTLDYAGAVKLMEVARRNAIDRYVIVSSMGADPEAEDDGGFGTYLRAKGQADKKLTESGLAYTIIRPGGLTNEPGTGLIAAGPRLDRGQIPRADVAATIAAVLDAPSAASGTSFDLLSGDTPIADAIAALAP
jgi:nucleoside-diphosphate-sugar epimerase